MLISSCNSNLIQLSIVSSHSKHYFHNYSKVLAKPGRAKTRCQQLNRLSNTDFRQLTRTPRSKRSCLISMAVWGAGDSMAGDNSPEEACVKYVKCKSFKPVALVPDFASIAPIPRVTKMQWRPSSHLHLLLQRKQNKQIIYTAELTSKPSLTKYLCFKWFSLRIIQNIPLPYSCLKFLFTATRDGRACEH